MESLKADAEEKVAKINKYMDSPVDAHIVLAVEKFRHQANVAIGINGTRINGVEETWDMYSAIDKVMDKIEKQVKRHMTKVRDRRSENQKNSQFVSHEKYNPDSLVHEERVIEVKKMITKPMDSDEAAMQLNLSRQGFMVFRDARSGEINVIYKRKDGNLGLIETVN
ncbi:MAG: ribosome-associated translation inhibitor RaiA [Deltaproteobacteria bacterium]|nr:ribosome-associated translation inhibitor RaiA [Deltaproteobacteria bacterium]